MSRGSGPPPSSGFCTMLNCALKTHKNTALPCHHNSNCKTTVQNATIIYCFETLLKKQIQEYVEHHHLNMMDIAKQTKQTQDAECTDFCYCETLFKISWICPDIIVMQPRLQTSVQDVESTDFCSLKLSFKSSWGCWASSSS